MKKSIIVAGISAIVLAGAATGAALAQSQAQGAPAAQPAPPPPPPGGPGFRGPADPGGPGWGGPGFHGPRGEQMGRGGQGGRFDGRFRRGRPTVEELQKRNAEWFAQIDANKDGKATVQEFQAFREKQRQDRERAAFQRFSGGQDSVTLQQLNARTAERFNQAPARRGAPGAPPAPRTAPAR